MKLVHGFPLFLSALFTVSLFCCYSYATFNPVDNFLIACGSSKSFTFQGRTFVPDSSQSSFMLKSEGDFVLSTSSSSVPSPIYQSMRVFLAPASYVFEIRQKGWHWLRLYFRSFCDCYPSFESPSITVVTEEFVLLNKFSFRNHKSSYLFKEYVINVNSSKLTITFIPSCNSVSFVSGIEVVSIPEGLLHDQNPVFSPPDHFKNLSSFALETMYRLNMGGPLLTPQNDTLGRTWENDHKYIHLDTNGSIATKKINPENVDYQAPVTPETAPNWVYATAVGLGNVTMNYWIFNITWVFPVEADYAYFVRLHFCDIVSKYLNNLAFNVYINSDVVIPFLDLSSITGGLAIPYFQDFITFPSRNSRTFSVGVGPGSVANVVDAILNGLEIMKISNSDGSLDGFLSAEGLLLKQGLEKKAG